MADNLKIRYAWTPDPRSSQRYLTVLAVGIVMSWVVTYASGLLAITAILGSFNRDPTTRVYGAAMIIGVFGALGFVWALSRLRYRRVIRRQPFRRARLDRLATQDNVWRRLPHRMVEKALFMRTVSSRRMKRLLRKLAPGDTVLLNWPRGAGHQRPKANMVPFEPMDIDVEDERLIWLSVLNMQEQGDGGIEEVQEQREDDEYAPSLNPEVLWLALSVLSMLVGFLYWIRGFVIGRSLTSLIIIVFTLGFFLLWWLLPLFAERKWWLVPGGMICREFRFWRRGHRADLVTPAKSPLVIDMRSGMGYLLCGRAVRSFACPEWTAWAVAAGWMSRARTPTMEEVRAFLLTSD